MATINNLAAFDAAIRAVCPAISGVAADATIMLLPSATAAQIAAAQSAALAYVDPPPTPVPDLVALVAALASAGTLPQATIATIRKPPPVLPVIPITPAPTYRPVPPPPPPSLNAPPP